MTPEDRNPLPIVPIGVHDAPFTLDLMARDCPPLQFLREFTVNGIEAIEAYRAKVDADYRGQVTWTLDRNISDATLGEQVKLCCIDTGIGMSAAELPAFMNDLTSSGKVQGLDANYGIGAKVSAARRNPHGVIYLTWKDGIGSMVELGRDEHGIWGMRQHRLDDGTVVSVWPLDDSVKPAELRGLDHGTMVVFGGESDADNTTLPPEGIENREKWIAKALNLRFHRLPEYVEVKARDWPGGDDAAFLRTVRGQEHFLDQHTAEAGVRDVTGARVHWRILDEKHVERRKQGAVWASTGHRAALWQDELYELVTAGRGGFQRVKEFGVNFGYDRVVIYVEPVAGPGQVVTPNTSRTEILIDNEPMPWDRIAAEFEEHLPEELRAFQEAIAAGSSSKDHRKAIRERLAQIAELFHIPRYRPAPAGERELDEPNTGGAPARGKQRKRKTAKSGTSGGTTGNVYALFQRPGGPNGDDVDPRALPDIEVDWVSAEDGTRTPPYLEDRAAQYDQRHNRLEINADFRGYQDMLKRWQRRYGKVAGAQAFIDDTVAQWFQQALTETVLGVLALRGSEYWAQDAVDAALSEEALSAAVMQRYHLDATLKRELASKLGAVSEAA